MIDEFKSYKGLKKQFSKHCVIKHSKKKEYLGGEELKKHE